MLRCTKHLFSTLLLGFLCLPVGFSQNGSLLEPTPLPYTGMTPSHMWEFGLHSGIPLALGDVDFVPGFGGGFHVRRALDYVFSLRSEFMVGTMRNEDTNDGNTKTTWTSGTFEVIASLNNLIWSSSKNRKTNFYGLVGVGLNRFKVDVVKAISADIKPNDFNLQSHGGLGIGFSVRMLERFNIGVETKAWVLFGKDSDRLDAVERQEGDVMSYSSLRLNFNLGNKEKKSEPLYWVNPMDAVMQDITELKNRPDLDLTDTDQDGVIDLLDQDNETPPGVQVDTRGLPLDSDGDGIPNHEDANPYFPSVRAGADQVTEPIATEADIERIVNERLGEYDRTGIVPQPGSDGKGGAYPNTKSGGTGRGNRASLANWFLPLIHFDIDSYNVRYADYGSLSSIGKMMNDNMGLRLVVTGFTDKTASESYNNELSYKRAKSAIDHLVKIHGIDRSRLVLQFNGEDDPLVPSTGSNLMNRRVEFRAATETDQDMPAPTPYSNKKGKKRGF